jgi:light-regulated signal transduction histidine kinase (bacteriophytochrome)
MMIVTALIVAWLRPGRVTWTAAKIAEGFVLLVLLVLGATEVFTGRYFGPYSESLGFVVLPFIIWAAIRFGGREAVTLCVVASTIALAATVNGTGPFAGYGMQSLLLQQAFIATLVATGLVLAGLMRQLNRLAETKRRQHAEMEHMIHLAAHDLQEPIRTVINFSDLLKLRYADRLGAEGLDYLRFVTGGATQSRQLIGELLELLEAGRRSLVLETTPAERVVDAALESLRGAVEASGATVSVSPLPELRIDRRLMQSVFQNLLGNAIRYRSREPPRVKVSAQRDGRSWIFSVRDNGIGIEPRFHGEIFEAFKRFAARDAEEGGAGLGLALCKKVIERHGGRIWLESPPSGGSIFHFSLPAEAAAHGTG